MERNKRQENPDSLAFLIPYVYCIRTFCCMNSTCALFTVTTLTAKNKRHVQIFVSSRANASRRIQPSNPRLDHMLLSGFRLSHRKDIFCLRPPFFHSFRHPLLHFSHSHFFFLFLRLTRFHAQPAKEPRFSCLRPRLWRSVGMMWGGTSSEQRATWAVVCRESVKTYTNIQ